MAKLNDISIPTVPEIKGKGTIPVVYVPDGIVSQYNEAKGQVDANNKIMERLKPTLQKIGLEAVFEHNCAHADEAKAQISSVNLMDRLPEGMDITTGTVTDALKEVCMFTWTTKDTANDPKKVVEEFNRVLTVEGKKANINNYAAYEVVASFDTSVFKGANGKFSQERYDAYMEALVEVSTRFGVENPLSCGKVLKPKPDFHDRRWKQFDKETNLQLHAILPTQVNLKPVRQKKE